MEKDSFLTCPVCIDIATEAVESNCCGVVFCLRCARDVLAESCPNCRAAPFKWKETLIARRMINSLPRACPNCEEKTTYGELKGHMFKCSKAVRKCAIKNCTFFGMNDEFLAHVDQNHHKEFLERFDQDIQSNMKNSLAAEGTDPIAPTKNNKGSECKLGSTGKFYCGLPLEGACCCDGYCGPTNGCNCRACMVLDIQMRRLEKGYWVNNEGATCRKGASGKVYCGRKKGMYHYNSNSYCGPNHGDNCRACQALEQQLETRYSGVN